MNIGIVSTWFERGAAYVSRQYAKLLRPKHKVFVYARGGERYARNEQGWDDDYVTWGKNAYPVAFQSFDLNDFRKWLKRNRIEVVFFNEQAWWPPVLLCNSMGILTGAYIDYYTEETLPFFLSYDFLICNTMRHYREFEWHPQAYYVKWGTDLDIFKPVSYDLATPGTLTFFHSAGMNPNRKGTDLVIKSFSKLSGKVHLVVHSQTDIRKFFPELHSTIQQLLLDRKLTYIEETVPEPGLYHLGDVYVYPSRLDGLGLTMAEALACGLPVVASDNAPMNELINDECGKLVKISKCYSRADGYYWPLCVCDVDDLAERMKMYVETIEGVPQFKKVAREYAQEKLNWNSNRTRLDEIFLNSKHMPEEKKRSVYESIKKYEDSKLSLKSKLYLKYPRSFNVAWQTWKIWLKLNR